MARGSEVYLQTLFDLAEQIRKQLKRMREGHKAAIASIAATLAQARSLSGSTCRRSFRRKAGTIYLAQVTDDLDEEREQVRRYVEQFGIAVLPEGTIPQGGADFAAAWKPTSPRSDAFVQLLGRTRAKRPPDMPMGYDRLQVEHGGGARHADAAVASARYRSGGDHRPRSMRSFSPART